MVLVSILCINNYSNAQIYFSSEATKKITGAACVAYEKGRDVPVYIKFRQGSEINFNNWQSWIFKVIGLSPEMGFSFSNVQEDKLGDLHYRFIQTYENAEIFGTTLIVHTKNGKVYSFNGKIIKNINVTNTSTLKESQALTSAFSYINAEKYKWQNNSGSHKFSGD